MKHLRHLFIVLLLLFVSATTMAQTRNEITEKNLTEWSTRADINGDGVVNMQDVLAIIAIMQKAGGVSDGKTKYYWYVGKINPAEMTSINVNDGWTEYTSQKQTPITISKQNADYSTNIWYIAAPYDWGYTLYNATGAASSEAGFNISTVTLGGVKYKVWASKAAGYQAVGQLIIK